MSTYRHLTAMLDGIIKDVLVDEELFEYEDAVKEDFFLSHATEISDQGTVEITGRSVLPDVIG